MSDHITQSFEPLTRLAESIRKDGCSILASRGMVRLPSGNEADAIADAVLAYRDRLEAEAKAALDGGM